MFEYKETENSAERKAFSSVLCIFADIFGTDPKVGDSITLLQAYHKTAKNKPNLDNMCRRWAYEGVLVEYTPNKENLEASTYTIKALPQIAQWYTTPIFTMEPPALV